MEPQKPWVGYSADFVNRGCLAQGQLRPPGLLNRQSACDVRWGRGRSKHAHPSLGLTGVCVVQTLADQR